MFNLCSKFLSESSCGKPNLQILTRISITQSNDAVSTDLVGKVASYVKSLGFEFEMNSASPIAGYTIDIWIPDKKLAIECHDLNWLNESNKKDSFDRTSSRKKLEIARKNDIHLMQFFSDELNSKWEICSSMISNALGTNVLKLSARDCDIAIISQSDSKKFVDENHISGSTRAKHHIALVHPKHGIVAVATTRTPIQKKYGHAAELARMCFLSGVSVRGGASKLLKRVTEIVKEEKYDCLLSYAELRFGEGNVYKTCGFDYMGESTSNYWYSDGNRRYDRFKFRAQPNKPEKIVAEENNVRSVWGAGNCIYLMKF